MGPVQRANALIAVTAPLLELYAVVNDVFTEDDALSADKRQISLGRIYEQWKRCTAKLDPDWRDPVATTVLDAARSRDAQRAADEGQFS